MAPTTTMYVFEIALTDMDRDVYATLNLRVAQHPSETVEYLLARVLAYCLEYTDGIAFSRGLADGDEPPVWVHDPTGRLTAWIEVGTPEAARLHTARKRAERVAVYCHKEPSQWLAALTGKPIFAADTIPVYLLDRTFLQELATLLDRRVTWSLVVTEQQLYLNSGPTTLESVVTLAQLPQAS